VGEASEASRGFHILLASCLNSCMGVGVLRLGSNVILMGGKPWKTMENHGKHMVVGCY